jgi:amidase
MRFQTPGGSSSGSGAGVAAGFAPIGVGSETDGSIIHPATRASLYGMKASVGAVSSDGAMPVCMAFDGHGAMSRTPRDLSDIMGILMGGRDFSSFLRWSWKGLRIGFVDPDVWRPSWFVDPHEGFRRQTVSPPFLDRSITESIPQDAETEEAKRKIRAAGAQVVENVPLITLAELAKVEEGLEVDDLFGDCLRSVNRLSPASNNY